MAGLKGRSPKVPVADGLIRITAATTVYKMLNAAAVTGVALLTARQLGPSGRGVVVLIITLATFALLVCSLGVNTSGRIYLVSQDSPVALGDYVGLSALLSVLEIGVCGAFGVLLLPAVHVGVSPSVTIVLGLLGGTLLAGYLLQAALNAYGANVLASAMDALGSVGGLVGVVVLVAAHVDTVDPYLVALIAGNVLQVACSVAALARKGHNVTPHYSRSSWTLLVRKGVPAIAMDVSQVLTFRLDRYLVGLFMTPAAVGIYSVAATAPEMLRVPVLSLAQPIFHRLASGSAKIRDFQRTQAISLAMTALLTAATALVAPLLVSVAFGADYAEAVWPLRILLLAEFGVTLYFLDSASLAAGLRRVGDAAVGAVVGLVVVCLADFLLIPAHGIAGAAWASVIAYTVSGGFTHALLRQRLTRMDPDEPVPTGAEPAPDAAR